MVRGVYIHSFLFFVLTTTATPKIIQDQGKGKKEELRVCGGRESAFSDLRKTSGPVPLEKHITAMNSEPSDGLYVLSIRSYIRLCEGQPSVIGIRPKSRGLRTRNQKLKIQNKINMKK